MGGRVNRSVQCEQRALSDGEDDRDDLRPGPSPGPRPGEAHLCRRMCVEALILGGKQ